MKLSATDLMTEYRAKLKELRRARHACRDGAKLNAKTWRDGEEIDFVHLLSSSSLRASLTEMLDREIADVTRCIEAHGVDVDE